MSPAGTDADVIIVAAACPACLMLAAEPCLAGVRPLVLERQPQLLQTPKASAFNGQIVELLRYRGLLERAEARPARPPRLPAPGAPFGGMHLDFSHLADPPLRAVHLAQPRLERLLSERAGELRAGAAARTRGDWGQPGRRRGNRGRARPGRAVPDDRSLPGGLRRRAQHGPRQGRDPVPRHHLSRGQPAGPGHRARIW